MGRLIKAECHQLYWSRAFRVFFILFGILGALMIGYLPTFIKWATTIPGLEITTPNPMPTPIGISYEMLSSEGIMIIIFYLTYLVYHSENSNRTIINLIATGQSRLAIYFSKWFTMLCAGVFTNLIYWAIILVISLIAKQPVSLFTDFTQTVMTAGELFLWWAMLASLANAFLFNLHKETWAVFLPYLLIIFGGGLVNILFSRFLPNFFEKLLPYLFYNLSPDQPLLYHDHNLAPMLMILWSIAFLFIGWIGFKQKEIR
ncbi:MAG: hypothetical protein Q4A67_01840 [Aerococcus sp.]|nr:hypothetical protein [Aerococcus sp.]